MSASDRHATFMAKLGDRLLFPPTGHGYTDGGAAEPAKAIQHTREGTGGRFARSVRRARS